MHEFKLPQLGQSVEEAAITQWLKAEGDAVSMGEPVCMVQTDKAEIEVEADAAGVLRKILVPEDEEVPVFTVIALIGDADEALPDSVGAAPAPAAAPAEEEPTATPVAAAASAAVASPSPTPASGDRQYVSPRARKTAGERNVSTQGLAGSGPKGRVIEEDVLNASPTAAAAPVASPSPTPVAVPSIGAVTGLSPMRKVIAERMVASKFQAPHFYVTVEVDMLNSVAFRQNLGIFKPSYNDLVLRAAARALQEYPQVNAQWTGEGIVQQPHVNMGMAVALEEGLIVPVIRNMEQMSLKQIHEAAREMAEKARTGKLMPDDYVGNTFTVSNLGVFGVDEFTAIINQPDSAILAVGQMKEQVVAIDGGIQVRPIMKMTVSSDHRVIDGSVAAQFMGRMKQILEEADF